MKRLILFILMVIALKANAQMAEANVYYYNADSAKVNIEYINPSNKVSGFVSKKLRQQFDGEKSENVVGNTYIYVEIPAIMASSINIKNFNLVTLEVKKGKREVSTFKVRPFGTTGAIDESSSPIKFEKVSDNVYRFSTESLANGHYGIFYNYYTKIIVHLYDFDVSK